MTADCANGVDTGFVALGYTKVILLGIVQGITELLPVSSTAHMRIVPALLDWQDPGTAFSAAMQLAALAAVISYFWDDIKQLVTNSAGAVMHWDLQNRHFRLSISILLATIPIGLAGLSLMPILNACASSLRTLPVIGWACIVMAILLALAEVFARHKRELESVSLADAMIVGIAQIGSLIPGVSRTGSTLTAALALGFKREEAARFSFLLGIPAIGLAGFRELLELHMAHLSLDGWLILLVGIVAASISAFSAIWGLMHLLERFSAWPFVIYRGVLGASLITSAELGWLN